MVRWGLLTLAIASEVGATLLLNLATSHPVWYPLVALGYLAAFILLARVLRRGMALGVAYGIWGASGVALTALLSAVIFSEPLSSVTLSGIALIVVGVLAVELGSQRATRKPDPTGS